MKHLTVWATMWIVAVFGLILAAGLPLSVHAEISPESYHKMQQAAGEHLTITVTKVIVVKKAGGASEVKAEATVKEVKKSASQLKVGDTITIQYDHTPLPEGVGFVGPAPIAILKEGQECPAYLIKEKKVFAPVARNYSFKEVR